MIVECPVWALSGAPDLAPYFYVLSLCRINAQGQKQGAYSKP
jgi:hypothetical protein